MSAAFFFGSIFAAANSPQMSLLSLSFSAFSIQLLFFNFCEKIIANPEESPLNFGQFYQFGKNEYTMENWGDCVAYMLRALENYRLYKDQVIWCRKMCHNRIPFGPGQAMERRDEDWDFIQDPTYIFMRVESSRALCLLRCRFDKFPGMQMIKEQQNSDQVVEEFKNRKPFHYLQFCYWKLGQLEHAVKAAFTFLVANPRNEETLENLHFYMEQPNFRHEMLQDSWQPLYQKLYMDAVLSYDRKEWLNCANLFREALDQFWEALDDCRMECEDELDWSALEEAAGNRPEWSVVLTSFHVSILRCRQQCPSRISILNGRTMPQLLVSHFDYMHLCQFNLKHGRDACQSVSNSLALRPKSIVMRRNKLFYKNIYEQEKGTEELFTISKEIRRFLRREELEKNFIKFVDDEFRFDSLISPSAGHSFVSISADYFPPTDYFDYSTLLESIFTSFECKFLRSAIDFFPQYFPRTHWLLVEELANRIGIMHEADAPKFKWIKCASSAGIIDKIDCADDRPAISVGLNENDCAKIGGEQFFGCAVIFCEN